MHIKVFRVNAFTHKLLKGNPAGVCILENPLSKELMQVIAKKMGLSETAFILKHKDGFNLRWFTPLVEVDLCGHATLASAYILWERGILKSTLEARFYTKSGVLTAKLKDNWIELNFPPEKERKAAPPCEIMSILGAPIKYFGESKSFYVAEVGSEAIVRRLKPDLQLMNKILKKGVIVTSKSASKKYDFVSRFFDPMEGIDEDPVTGSAHCLLGPFWQKRIHKNIFTAYQSSKRGGLLKVKVGKKRIFLNGQAVTTKE